FIGESLKGRFRARFNQGGMADQSDAFKLTLSIAVSIEGASIEGTLQTIVPNHACHEDCVRGTRAEKSKNFIFLPVGQGLNGQSLGVGWRELGHSAGDLS